ncbi:energy transducer TonB [Marinilabilia salmonicolor]|uniref:energy transducer TonB n=1 Tax=Marinilabilia salmonicolor TaxID=989 RepID=UPI00029B40BF|nr:energy transducer TonB [Marinilabilia salmonicolor]
MRNLFTFLSCLLISPLVISQNEELLPDTTSEEEALIFFMEQAPEFPGGMDSLWCFLESSLDFTILNLNDKNGRVIVTFEIDTAGTVLNIKTNPGYVQQLDDLVNDSLIEKEIKRVLMLSPKWSPAQQGKHPIKVKYTISLKIPYSEYKCKNIDNPSLAYWKVDESAKFNYGEGDKTYQSVQLFISDNMQWPSQDDCIGRVLVGVIIDKKGEITHSKIIRGLGSCRGFNEEALRLVKIMPEWEPAEIDGNPVKSYFVIPVNFVL